MKFDELVECCRRRCQLHNNDHQQHSTTTNLPWVEGSKSVLVELVMANALESIQTLLNDTECLSAKEKTVLLNTKAIPSSYGQNEHTHGHAPVFWAACEGLFEIVQILTEHQCDLKLGDVHPCNCGDNQKTVLDAALSCEDTDMSKKLVEYLLQFDLDPVNDHQFMLVLQNKWFDIADRILQSDRIQLGKTSCSLFLQTRDDDVLKWVLNSPKISKSDDCFRAFVCTKTDEEEEDVARRFELFVQYNMDPSKVSPNLLLLAMRARNKFLVEFLIRQQQWNLQEIIGSNEFVFVVFSELVFLSSAEFLKYLVDTYHISLTWFPRELSEKENSTIVVSDSVQLFVDAVLPFWLKYCLDDVVANRELLKAEYWFGKAVDHMLKKKEFQNKLKELAQTFECDLFVCQIQQNCGWISPYVVSNEPINPPKNDVLQLVTDILDKQFQTVMNDQSYGLRRTEKIIVKY